MAGMTAIATVISAVGAVAQAANNYQNYQAQAEAANINADIAANNAQNVLVQGNYEQDAKLQEGKQYISNQYVRNLVSGAGGAGTTGDRAVAKSVYNLENDLSMLSYNYQTKAIDFLNQSKMYKYESKVAKANAVNSLIQGGFGVANSVLTGMAAGGTSGGVGSAAKTASVTNSGVATASYKQLNNVPSRINYYFE